MRKSSYHFAHHKAHKDYSSFEPGPPTKNKDNSLYIYIYMYTIINKNAKEGKANPEINYTITQTQKATDPYSQCGGIKETQETEK